MSREDEEPEAPKNTIEVSADIELVQFGISPSATETGTVTYATSNSASHNAWTMPR
jgi:hypothetical protein